MGQYDARHSVPRPAVVRQTQSPPYSLTHVGRLGLAVLNDARLRRSALTVAVLAGLIVYGAADTLTEVPLRELAATLGSSYDSAYKATGRLARLGYVQLARAKSGQRRLSMRVVWPAVIPVPVPGDGGPRRV